MTTRPGFIWSGSEWVAVGQEAVVAPVSYQASAPTSPSTGDIWIDSDYDVPSVDTSQFLRWRKTMSGGETSVSGVDDTALTLAYTPNYEQVYLNGVLLVRGLDYTATNGTSVTGLTALAANDVVEVFSVVARTVADVYTQAQADAKYSLQTTTGGVLIVSQSFTSATTVTLTNCFSSSYDNYRVVLDITASSGSMADVLLQLKTGSTVSTSNYSYQAIEANSTTSTVNGFSSTTNTGFRVAYAGSTFSYLTTAVDLIKPYLAVPTKSISSSYSSWTGYTAGYISFINGVNTNATSYESLVLATASSPSITGTIKVYGYK